MKNKILHDNNIVFITILFLLFILFTNTSKTYAVDNDCIMFHTTRVQFAQEKVDYKKHQILARQNKEKIYLNDDDDDCFSKEVIEETPIEEIPIEEIMENPIVETQPIVVEQPPSDNVYDYPDLVNGYIKVYGNVKASNMRTLYGVWGQVPQNLQNTLTEIAKKSPASKRSVGGAMNSFI